MSADRLLALAAVALALVGVALALWVAIWMRRVRRAQSALLSGGPVSDLVEFAVGMQARQELVERRADELAARVEQAGIEVAGALRRVGLQRFDAYDGAEGLQSTALALLDALGDGIVVSAIQDSDSARVYVKRVRAGAAADVALGPEELAAVAAARTGIYRAFWYRATGRSGGTMTGQVLVLNATYEPLNVCSLRRACVLLLKAKAELVEALETAAALGQRHPRAPGRHPSPVLRPKTPRRGSAHHPAGGLRP